jgi:hypothetical protein
MDGLIRPCLDSPQMRLFLISVDGRYIGMASGWTRRSVKHKIRKQFPKQKISVELFLQIEETVT